MNKVDISSLSAVPETMLITVRARAIETDKPEGLVKDPYAKRIIKSLGGQEKKKQKVSAGSQVGVCVRTRFLDNVVGEFLNKSPEGTVVNIGCGLDARYERFNNGSLRWFDIDLPESIDIRKSFFQEGENYRMLPFSALDFLWIEKIPKDKPVLILSEGVLMYFKPEKAELLLSTLAERFPGGTMAIDTISPWVVKNSRRHPEMARYKARFHWGIESEDQLSSISSNIRSVDALNMMECYPKKWPLFMRLLTIFPKVRNSSKLVKMEFAK